jgi:aspartate kinase
MRFVVKKFGGTSVGNIERILEVAKKVAAACSRNEKVVVVVSAMAGDTDRLVKLGLQVCEHPDEREFDLLLSTGEMVSSALLAIALNNMGYAAESFTGRQVGILTDSVHTKARIRKIDGERIFQALDGGKIAVVAGFQGIDEREDMTTLGRGGSDTTAVALAAALNADRCEIYTDVDGIYTADPNLVPEARRLRKISYDEMLEMASLGAKVLQTRSVEVAKIYHVPVLVKSTFQEGEGTLVTREDAELEKVVVSGLTLDKNQARITVLGVPDRPGLAAKIFGRVSAAHIVVDMIVQNVSSKSSPISPSPWLAAMAKRPLRWSKKCCLRSVRATSGSTPKLPKCRSSERECAVTPALQRACSPRWRVKISKIKEKYQHVLKKIKKRKNK